MVSAAVGAAKVTVPGPLCSVHCSVAAAGIPSSVTVASSAASSSGSVIVWSVPASTLGAVLPAVSTLIVTSSKAVSSVSSAVRRST